jgi:hypothetical protein
LRGVDTIEYHYLKSDIMYEDSQRFSEGEEEEDSHTVTIDPRLLADVRPDRMVNRGYDVEPVDSTAFMMQRDAGRSTQSPLTGVDMDINTPEYTNIREESMQRILSRLSPTGRRTFLLAMSEGDGDVRTPAPFTVQDTDNEYESSEVMDQLDTRSEIDYLLDSSIPEVITRSLIPISNNEAIQSRVSVGLDPHVTTLGPKPKATLSGRKEESGVLGQVDLPLDPAACRTSMSYVPNDAHGQPNFHRPKAYIPTEQARMRVTKNLFPSNSDNVENRESNSQNRLNTKPHTITGRHFDSVNTTNTTWVYRHPRPSAIDHDSHPPVMSSRVMTSDQTYPKLLPTVELFSPPPIASRSSMAYSARIGAGYRVYKTDGTYEHRYFEPIPNESREIPFTERNRGGALYEGHGASSDQRRADTLLGGVTRGLGFSRPQRETAHSTGTPKFCGDTGAARGTFSLNRGTDFLHAPARLPATLSTQLLKFDI